MYHQEQNRLRIVEAHLFASFTNGVNVSNDTSYNQTLLASSRPLSSPSSSSSSSSSAFNSNSNYTHPLKRKCSIDETNNPIPIPTPTSSSSTFNFTATTSDLSTASFSFNDTCLQMPIYRYPVTASVRSAMGLLPPVFPNSTTSSTSSSFPPSLPPSFQLHNSMHTMTVSPPSLLARLENQREIIFKEARRRKLQRRKAWEELADRYVIIISYIY